MGYSLADLSTLKMEAICSSETSVHTRSTRRHIPEDGIRQMGYIFERVVIGFAKLAILASRKVGTCEASMSSS
jgi:hypothetical protein